MRLALQGHCTFSLVIWLLYMITFWCLVCSNDQDTEQTANVICYRNTGHTIICFHVITTIQQITFKVWHFLKYLLRGINWYVIGVHIVNIDLYLYQSYDNSSLENIWHSQHSKANKMVESWDEIFIKTYCHEITEQEKSYCSCITSASLKIKSSAKLF